MPTLRIQKGDKYSIYFITITTIEWIDIFTKEIYFETLLDSLKFCQKNKGLRLHGFVFMTNHIHLIGGGSEKCGFDEIIRDFKKFTTFKIKEILMNNPRATFGFKENRNYILRLIRNSYFKKKRIQQGSNQRLEPAKDFQIWQRENFPRIIETEKFFNEKLNYIHNNPVKRGYVAKPEDWKYSSARNYFLRDDSLIKIDYPY